MTGFVDVYLPERILGYQFRSLPRWSTAITAVASGSERRNQNWADPLHTFTAPEGVRCWEDVEALHRMWMVFRGPKKSFAFRDPMDFASRSLLAPDWAPATGPTDQIIGVGDGFVTQFQLSKTYEYEGETYARKISHPIVSTVEIAMSALPPETSDPPLAGGPYTWEVSRLTGLVTIAPAPEEGVVISAGFLFDVEARFENDDSYEGIVAAYRAAGMADLTFLEVRPC